MAKLKGTGYIASMFWSQVLVSYMNPGEKWPPDEGSQEAGDESDDGEEGDAHELPSEFIDLVANSSLVPAICSYLRNDSGEYLLFPASETSTMCLHEKTK